MLFPTSHLPSIKSIKSIHPSVLHDYVVYLRQIFSPPVRGSRRRNRKRDSSETQETEELDALRSDAFERDYAMRWLTALISQIGSDEISNQSSHCPERDSLIQISASLLATCAGTASAGVVTRTFAFNTTWSGIGSSQIYVHLTDFPLDNHDYGSVGAQTWGGACIMAEMIAERPEDFGLPEFHPPTKDVPLRCLELGAGTGLVSLTVGRVAEQRTSDWSGLQPAVEIVPTDYYPLVLENLQRNIESNFPPFISSAVQIHPQTLDWALFSFSETSSDLAIFQQPFDVIYGADIIYEAQHAEWIKFCLHKLLRKPRDVSDNPTFHLVIPLRRTHTAESSTIEQLFKEQITQEPSIIQTHPRQDELVIKHKETIICDAQNGSSDEVEYTYYRIGWKL